MNFDATKMSVFGIPPYIFFAGIGATAAIVIFNCVMFYLNADIKLGNRAAVFSIPALLLGAKFFGIIGNLIECIVYNKEIDKNTFIYSGIVFYGGLIFFITCFLIIIRKRPSERLKITDSIAVSIPFFHAFGRIGCFTAGCCYGIQTESSIGINYTTWIRGEAITANRVPVQLLESCGNIFIFIILLQMVLKKKQEGNLLIIYTWLYSVMRFSNEFLRGDINKSILHGFSAAQLISLILFVVASIKILKTKGRKICSKAAN